VLHLNSVALNFNLCYRMNKYRVLFFLLLYFLAFINQVSGQAVSSDSSLQRATTNMANVYLKSISTQSGLYRGAAYDFYDFKSTGSPYFKESSAFNNGSISYDGVFYKDIPLIYDQYNGLLITLLYNNFTKFSLLSEYISEFNLHGHHFIKLKPHDSDPNIETDWYDELYNDKLQLVVRRRKTLGEEGITAKKIFRTKDTFFLKKGAVYYKINSNSKFWDVLNDKKKELKRYLKDKNLNLTEDRESTLLSLVAYYDQISN
jgi:hypothetical protein